MEKDISGNKIVVQFYSKSKYVDDLVLEFGTLNWRYVLSNFYPKEVNISGIQFKTAEHGFQGAKYLYSNKPEIVAEFMADSDTIMTAEEAKSAGGKKGMRDRGAILDISLWNSNRENIMYEIVKARWEQDPLFRNILRAIQAREWELLHFERAGVKSFWGGVISKKTGKICGKNVLGELLMKISQY